MSSEIVFRNEDKGKWSAFWRTAGGSDGCKRIAAELGISGEEFVKDIRGFLFPSPGQESAERLIEGLKSVRETIRRGVYESDRQGIGGLSAHAEHSA